MTKSGGLIIAISSRMHSSQVLNAMRPASGPHFGDWPTHWKKFTVICFPNRQWESIFSWKNIYYIILFFIHNIPIATQECWRVIMNGGCSSYSLTDVSIM